MTLLLIGMAIFIGIHLLPTFPGVRLWFINRYGLYPFKGRFALIAMVGLLLTILGYWSATAIPLWIPPAWGRHAAYLLMLPALILVTAAYLPGNIKRYTRHPMLWGVSLWSIGHLLANSDLASLIIFAGVGLFALFDMWSANKRGAVLSAVKRSFAWDLLVIGIGVIAYIAVLTVHPMSSALRLFG